MAAAFVCASVVSLAIVVASHASFHFDPSTASASIVSLLAATACHVAWTFALTFVSKFALILAAVRARCSVRSFTRPELILILIINSPGLVPRAC